MSEIFVLKDGETLVSLTQRPYESDVLLQALLAKCPSRRRDSDGSGRSVLHVVPHLRRPPSGSFRFPRKKVAFICGRNLDHPDLLNGYSHGVELPATQSPSDVR